MARRDHVIGITGNIASGKSVVLGMLADLGAETIDADQLVHKRMGPGSELAGAIEAEFGSDVINPDRSINRPALGEVVFGDPEKLERLEEIIHPAVVSAMLSAIESAGPPVLVLDAIKLFEAGIADHCDEVWVIDADRDTRIERLMQRNGFDREQAKTRVDAQPPQREKVERATIVIDNSGSLEDTRAQVEAEWRRLTGDV
ncbi:MAG: dephospho-CoA kinase [Chloroflexota bacterium]